jgi:hypothetical protein
VFDRYIGASEGRIKSELHNKPFSLLTRGLCCQVRRDIPKIHGISETGAPGAWLTKIC